MSIQRISHEQDVDVDGIYIDDLSQRPLPADRDNTVVQRILIRRGVSRDMTSLLLDAIKDCLQYFAENPVSSKAVKAGYHH